ncbi:MAG: tRNA 2-thiouridine(34) synthase MnmA [Luteitalea sp.]|nr:tRNA 2-thiouridine(34) synthase MnmA [Luteitalea sp.]
MRAAVAMSGGVDSSVAAALLADEGYETIGLSMQLYDQREGEVRFGRCCTLDDLHDARRVAGRLGLPHYIVNFESQFHTQVVDNFVREYVSGRTPIPCTRCNSEVKFATLLDRVRGLDAECLATGHYAQVDFDETTRRYRLRRGRDTARDQSYFLFSLTQAQLARARFPVGHLTKPEVRAIARERGLPVADKPDSQEICFVPPGRHAEFVERHAVGGRPSAGVIADEQGRPLGRHDGVHRFTVGQRKGLGLATGIPLYVVAIDSVTNEVTVGPREALGRATLTAATVNWVAGTSPSGSIRADVQIRHRHRPAPASVTPISATRARIDFDEPQAAIAPGQAAVFYADDKVLGGGWIE